MKWSKTSDSLLNIILPLLLGAVIYWVGETVAIPAVVRNYLPDGFWAYAFISSILVIWGRKIHIAWIVTVFLVSVCFELLQYYQKIAGTGDIKDVITYFTAFTIALISNTYFRNLLLTTTPII